MRRVRGVSGVAAVVVLSACIKVATPRASVAPPSGQLAFARAVTLETHVPLDLFLINEDGTGLHALSAAPPSQDYFTPAWSPDGRQLAFVHYNDSKRIGRLFTARVVEQGHEPKLVDLECLTPSDGPGEEDPAWSPDGRQLLFVRGGAIFVRLLKSPDARQLTFGGDDFAPTWSPTGDRIAFVRGRALVVMSAAGGEATQLAPASMRVGALSWHPSGDRLAVAAGSGGGIVEVGARDSDGDGTGDDLRVLTTPGTMCDTTPAYSPRGDRLAFSRMNCDPRPDNVWSDIFVRTLSTGLEENLTKTPNDSEMSPAWRPTRHDAR